MKRYPWLDGLRGLAALYVLLHHAAAEVNPKDLTTRVVEATGWLEHGHRAVAVFIVLSGFSLMLPVVGRGGIRDGFRGYLARRARRIWPAYYASLALILLLIAASPRLQSPNGNERWDFALPAFDLGAIVAHLLLVHDLSRSWIFKVDPPMWSVAVEWQIYFLFPILVLAWKRGGHPASLVLALLVGQVTGWLMGPALAREACPWYALLFAMGMLAASVKESFGPMFARGSWLPWLIVAGLTFDLGFSNRLILGDLLVGLATAASLTLLGRGDGGIVSRGMGARPLGFLGSISYSLYLIHFPLLSLASNEMIARGVGPGARLATLLFVASPTIVAVSWAFHLAFERPFLAASKVVDGRVEVTAGGRPVAGLPPGRSARSRRRVPRRKSEGEVEDQGRLVE